MIRRRRGFTLVEVSLFLAITAAIFVGVVAGTQSSIFQQRYNDAVQSFVDFLRNNYSQVMNVQSDGKGNSDYVIYGRIISFGNGEDDRVISYSVIGDDDARKGGEESLLYQLASTGALTGGYVKNGEFQGAGLTETYIPKWGSRIQIKEGSGFKLFEGAIMIVRHPETGSIYTYATENTSYEEGDSITEDSFVVNGTTRVDTLDLCVNPNGETNSNFRKDVRIVKDAKNASGVILVPDDAEDNKCK